MSEVKNLVAALTLALLVLLGWQFFYEAPRAREIERLAKEREASMPKDIITTNETIKTDKQAFLSRSEALKDSGPRLTINADKISGSISLIGARFDDISLKDYKVTDKPNSEHVILFSPSKFQDSYFAEFGWVSDTKNIEFPTSKTLWKANKDTLKSNDSIELSWTNPQNITFKIIIHLDTNYLFTIKQIIENHSTQVVEYNDYALINRDHQKREKMYISHEGVIGVFNKLLKEVSYQDLESDGPISFQDTVPGGWLGISDKYWLSAILPNSKTETKFNANFKYNNNKYQVDYLSQKKFITPGNTSSSVNHLFAGAKVLSLLDFYEQYLKLDLFDRAIDFGWFYFITKPIFNALRYCYDLVGNFGISIILITILIKLLLLPLATKSYRSMNRMKELQPQMESIKSLYKDDKVKQNQAIMELYKKEKVSPLSGCLPLLIQIPIFFSLYKVLYITIEMRQAPFYGWIHDLSAPDPTTIFNFFGLIPWTPPSFLMIGAWPILMALTMFIQQKFNPEPNDPVQAKVMKLLPLFFIFMFASFPAGLVIYWAFSNIISIIQQALIKYQYEKR